MINMCALLEQGKPMKFRHSQIQIQNKYFFRILLFCLIASQWSCGSSQFNRQQANLACKDGLQQLKRRIGPEFSKIISITPLPINNNQFGCALVYTQILEELPGEIPGMYIPESEPQELAFVIPDFNGRQLLSLPSRPSHRKGSVEMLVKLMEVHRGQLPEIVVEEREIGNPSSIYAMRIFVYAEGVPAPKEIFSERMGIKSPSGFEEKAEWLIGEIEGLPSISLKAKGSSKIRIYMWEESLQRYEFDLAVTQRQSESANASQPILNRSQKTKFTPMDSSKKQQVPTSLVPVIDQGTSSYDSQQSNKQKRIE